MSSFDALLPFYPDIGAPSATYSTAGLEPLSYELDPNGDGKSVKNHPRPDGVLSPFYEKIWHGDDGNANSKAWVDFHIYHQPNNPNHVKYAHKLYEAVRREFPELRMYRFFDKPLGPHPIPMFEVNVFTPTQLGALFTWLMANRGPCSVLIHPNTGDDVGDHTERATWMGERVPLDVDLLRAVDAMRAQEGST
ncbi:hypothetical protein CC85DRAFT_265328 [Cutaneotrichosporon oleaginosum]|uniref:DOPA 4,5-dioxygenase n=1 Tax=Cutaneotrichosporon oleaginosum TaxID=879819 RepID=A0A0J0XEK0_9TREE|nr:uncharacterized protein CC85DRAFT_265328 [Cutaneotrichosporon oleaginosum]KLT39491.1 hypothetical protein CC85DRAFT_265328 [Cutaneotrichosporon oleaginosum]TXT06844.1 hypothetical protein COLE_06175 [Cutaneotrichosporon oleaginosum]